MSVHLGQPGSKKQHINAFDEVEQFNEYGSVYPANEPQMALPYSILSKQPIIAQGNRFYQNELPCDIRGDGVYLNNHRLDMMPIIVEKEVIKTVYLTPTNPISAAISAYRSWRKKVSEGNQLYEDQFGQIHIRSNVHDE